MGNHGREGRERERKRETMFCLWMSDEFTLLCCVGSPLKRSTSFDHQTGIALTVHLANTHTHTHAVLLLY